MMKVAETRCPVYFFGMTVFQVLNKRRQCEFCLVEDQVIYLLKRLWFRSKKGSPRDDFQSRRLAAVNDLFGRLPLNGHSPNKG